MPLPPPGDPARIEPLLDEAALGRAILDGAAHAILSTDTAGLIRTFNPAAERLLGFRADEVVGRATPMVFHDPAEVARRAQALSLELDQTVPTGFEAFVARVRLGLPDQQEWTWLRKDGLRVPVSLSVSALRGADEGLAGFMGIAVDLTHAGKDRQDAERLLRDLEHLKAALDASAMISVTDGRGIILEVNARFCALSGYAPGELAGRSHNIVNSGFHPPECFRELWDTILAGRVWRGELRNRAKGGGIYWVDATIAPLLDREGRPTKFLALQFDITARKAAEAALRASEESLARAQSIAHLGNWDWELGTGRIAWSDEIFRIFGHGVQAFTPTYEGFMEAVHPDDRDRIKAAVDHALAVGALYGAEHRILRPDGAERVVVERGKVFRDAEGQALRMVGTVQDVTERRAADRLKREFVATVSHELRTPMTAIKGSLGLLAGGVGGELPPVARELVVTAQKHAERLLHLINELLDLEKVETGRMAFDPRPHPLAPLLRRSLGDLRDYALGQGVACELEPMGRSLEKALASVDEGRFLQVLANLLGNAIKFSPGGTTVWLRLLRAGRRLRLEVENAGPGIPPAFRDRIFDRFAQADGSDSRQWGGTGLGLSIAKALVERMGGQIGFESVPGRTVFFIELPEVAP